MTKHEEKALRISGDFFSHQPVSEDFFFLKGGASLSRNKKQMELEAPYIEQRKQV